MDPQSECALRNNPAFWDFESIVDWKDTMRRSLQKFGLNDQEFQFCKLLLNITFKQFNSKLNLILI